MSTKMKKFDVWVLNTSTDRFRYIKPVSSLDTFQGMTRDFHEDGLFSTSIFGKVGTQDRNLRMSYINVKIQVFAPKIYFLICAYKQLYKNMVIPAGLRDVEIADNDEITKHEVNDFYVKLLSIANSLPDSGDLDSSLTDRARLSIQLTSCELYDYLSKLTGQLKKSFARRKWGSRRVKFGSRNVITSLPDLPAMVNDPRVVRFNETAIGLYQAVAVYSPLLINKILNGYAQYYMNPNEGVINLINPKSLVREEVKVKPKVIDKWTTPTGIGKVIDGFEDKHLRNRPIIVKGYYLGLVYKDETSFRLINDINDLAERQVDVSKVSPLTYGELFYIHGYKWFSDYPGTVTRYPINGYRSIYPCYPNVFTTDEDKALTELNENFEPTDQIAYHYPNTQSENWFDGMALNQSRLEGLGGDYDGDMCNFNPVFSEEARGAIKRYLESKAAYLNSAGQLLHNPFIDTLERVLWSLSGDVK